MTLTGRNSTALLKQEKLPSGVLPGNKWWNVLSKYHQRIFGGVLFVVALGFNLYRLGTPSIWFDEAFSVELARQPFPILWHIIFGVEPNMELYYLFLHFWLNLTGWLGFSPTEFVVRFPSAIFAALGTVVVFQLGRRFISLPAGLVAAGLYLLNDLQLLYAQQTRAYSLQLLLTCLSWYALLSALAAEKPKRVWWVGFIVATVLAVYTHLFSFLILLAQMVTVGGLMLLPSLWRQQTLKQCKAFFLSLIVIGILVVPMILVARQGPKTGWLPIPHFNDLMQLFFSISGYNRWYLLLIAICCVLALSLVLLAVVIQRLLDHRQRMLSAGPVTSELLSAQTYVPIAWALLCWLTIPIIVSYLLSQGSIRLFSSRYLVTIVPPLLLLLGLFLQILRWRAIQVVVAIVLVTTTATSVPLYYRSAQVEDWNQTTHWLQKRYQEGDGLVCFDNNIQQGCQVAVEYYLHAYPGGAHFTPDAPGGFSWEKFGPVDPVRGFDAAVEPDVLAAYGAKHSRLFFIVGRVRDDAAATRAQEAQQWLDNNYRLLDLIETRTVAIRLYETTPETGTGGDPVIYQEHRWRSLVW